VFRLFSLPVLDHTPAWRWRLLGEDFIQPPWLDSHPQRLARQRHLPDELLRLARGIDSLVDRLDLAAVVSSFSGRGRLAHRPDLMLKAVLLLSQRGFHSPAAWFRQCQDRRAVAWLLRGLRPSRCCWYALRQRLLPFIDDLNRQLLHMAHDAGRLIEAVPVLDGSFLAANGSRRHLINLATLLRRRQQLADAIATDERANAGPAEAAGAAPLTPSAAPAESPPAATLPATPTQPCAPQARPLPVPTLPALSGRQGLIRPAWMASTARGRKHQQQRYLKGEK
jgi:hypothetical protein